MRILQVIDTLRPGGAQRHVIDLVRHLEDCGHEVEVAVSAPADWGARQLRRPVAVVAPHEVRRRFDCAYAEGIARHHRQGRYDVVHAHLFASGAAAAAALPRTVPLVLTEHSQLTWRTTVDREMSARTYARADHIVAVADAVRARVVTEGVLPARCSVIRNAVRVHPPRAPRKVGPWLRLGFLARLEPGKGLELFLDVVERAGALGYVAGSGSLLHACVGRQIRLLGWSDPGVLFDRIDGLLVTSESECCPYAVLDAMAAGVPVIARAVGGVPELIDHGRNGFLVNSGSVDEWTRAVRVALKEPRLAASLAVQAWRDIASQGGPSRMAEAVTAVYATAFGAEVRHPVNELRPSGAFAG